MSRALLSISLLVATSFIAQIARAETPAEILAGFKSEAASTAGFTGFSAPRGETFFKAKHGGEWSCSSCHTENPAAQGKHAKTEKVIKPLAPSANAERFSDPEKVAKWFKRNCKDVLERECTAQEKGDVMTYLMAVGTKQAAAPEAAKVVEAQKTEAAKPVAATDMPAKSAPAAHHAHKPANS
jgi:hypothetical protein